MAEEERIEVRLLSSVVGDEAELLQERPFQLLFLSNMLPPLGTALLSPVLGSLIDPLGTTPANIGLVMSAFTAPAIITIPIVGVIADRYGRRPVILFGLVWFGVAGSAIALTTNFQLVLFLRVLQGIGFAALTPIIITSIGDLYAGTKEATAQGLRFTGSGISQTIFPLGAGVLVGLAWRYPFLLYAIAFPIAAVVYIYFEEPVDSDAASDSGVKNVRQQLRALWSLVSQRRVWAMVIVRGTPNIVWLGFLTYNSIIVVDLIGGTATEAGLLAALGSLSYALSATQAGRLSARFDSRLFPLIVMNVAMASGLCIVFIARTLLLAFVGIVFLGIGFGLTLSLYRSIITNLASPSARGGLVSLAEGVGRITSTLTPIGMGATIAIATRWMEFSASVRLVGVGTGLVAATIGIVSLGIVNRSPPTHLKE
ncbi:MFS transporter [Halegenticoccus soli]|uniref:MFS transporter n=1 Tax=Halegenticoccus soli TaxID=1985678 RepID=UPI001E2B8978|nr:MFS transporter [Halegenticoccus soli]